MTSKERETVNLLLENENKQLVLWKQKNIKQKLRGIIHFNIWVTSIKTF